MTLYDIVVIGGGVGGLNIASASSSLGLKVALIEKEKLGGDCLWYGCVPSKTLIKSAKVMHNINTSKKYGITAKGKFNIKDVIKHVQDTINIIKVHDDPERFRKMGINVIFGSPKFISKKELKINDQIIKSKKFVISTGSSPFIPNIKGLKQAGYLDNTKVFQINKLPKSLAVLGAGPIGLELAQAFSRLGSKVSIIVRSDKILSKEDPEISKELKTCLEDENIKFYFNTKFLNVEKTTKGKKINLIYNGKKETCLVNEILVATGRTPNTSNLNLEKANIKYDNKGIVVDSRLRTTNKNVYACGDVIGHFIFTHIAEYQAGIIVSNIVFKIPKKTNYRVIPWATFTDPEIARVGLTEQQVKNKNLKHKILKYKFSSVDRAITDSDTKGFVKLIIDHKSKILGCHIIGPSAGELIHEFVLAMNSNLSIFKISQSIHIYPTLSQVARRTVNTYYGKKLFSNKTKKIVKILSKIIR